MLAWFQLLPICIFNIFTEVSITTFVYLTIYNNKNTTLLPQETNEIAE
jgi:hypothetical protein